MMPCHAYMQDAAMVGRHAARYGTDLDRRTLEILLETIDRDVNSFLPVLEEFKRHAPDLVAEAEQELGSVRTLRASLEVA